MVDGAVRVSVVIPAFNAGPFIDATLASALAQTEGSIELLVVDDGSTDDTAERVRNAAARDNRVRLLSMLANAGPAAARNRGLDAAAGEWVALLDADDRFEPHRLRTLLALAEETGADMVSDNLLLCEEGSAAPGVPMIPPAWLPRPQPLSAAEFVERNIGSRHHPRVSYGFMQPLLRRSFLDAHALRYDERNRFGEDFLFCLDCLLAGARWWIVPEAMYLYTLRRGSLTEVQTSADLGRISATERDLLARMELGRDARLARALRRHKRGIDRRYHYRAFTDALKSGAYARAAALLAADRRSIAHIGLESLCQAPVILRKAWNGGYRRQDPPCPSSAAAQAGNP